MLVWVALAATSSAAAPRHAAPGPEMGAGASTQSESASARARVARTKATQGKPARGRAARTAGRSRTGSGGGSGSRDPHPTAATAPLRVLFIGNSHTDRHGGMDWLVSNLAASEDPPRKIVTERLVGSGVTLDYHVKYGALKRIRDGDWDVVVIQEYLPGIPARSVEPFYASARVLDAAIRETGARTVLYMTWPERRHTWASLDDIADAHRQLATELGAAVAPVGVAMERAQAERPDLTFLDWDGVHTTWGGAYLAAATIYAALFERSPEGLHYHLGLSDDGAAFLQRIAWETVTDWRADPEVEATTAASDESEVPPTG